MKTWFRVSLFLLLAFSLSVTLTGCKIGDFIKKIGDLIGKKPPVAEPATPTGTTTGTTTGTATGTPTGTATGSETNSCKITVYGTSTCGYCTKAKEYLTSKGISFADKNVGTDAAAKQEMMDKAKAQGLNPTGVPVIDICGDMVIGFDQARIDELLKKHGFLGGTAAGTPTGTSTGTTTGTTTGTATGGETNACTVTVYGTSSCPWCTKAKDYLKSKCVTFADKDVGKDSAANQEMAAKAKAAGITPGGVPVIDICGDLVVGFNQSKIDQLLQKHGFTGCPTGNDPQQENPGN